MLESALNLSTQIIFFYYLTVILKRLSTVKTQFIGFCQYLELRHLLVIVGYFRWIHLQFQEVYSLQRIDQERVSEDKVTLFLSLKTTIFWLRSWELGVVYRSQHGQSSFGTSLGHVYDLYIQYHRAQYDCLVRM